MKRVMLLAGLVVAIVVPAVLLTSGPAQAKPQFYSARQVLRVFKAHRIALRPAPDDDPNTGRASFSGLGKSQLSITVLGAVPTVLTLDSSCTGYAIPTLLSHGNVEVSWCSASKADARRINAALGNLQYSAEEALHPLPPTVVLHVGTTRTIDAGSTPAGAAVDCVNGAATASQPVRPGMRASQTEDAEPSDVAGAPTDYATLAWYQLSGSRFRFSCR